MDFYDYLWKTRVRMIDFSKKTGISKGTLSLIKNGKGTPSLPTAIAMVEASDNLLTYEGLLKDLDKDILEQHREKMKNV